MSPITFSLLALLLTIICLTAGVEPVAARRHSRIRAYLEAQCRVTRYPKLCFDSLYTNGNTTTTTPQDPKQLAKILLTVTLTKAQDTKAYVSAVAKKFSTSKSRDLQVLTDCLHQINDGVDQITQSVKEFQAMGHDVEAKFVWHENNIYSWISTALTDTTICIEGFSGHVVGGDAKSIIKAKVENVAQLTSNALALFSRFAARHRSSRAFKLP